MPSGEGWRADLPAFDTSFVNHVCKDARDGSMRMHILCLCWSLGHTVRTVLILHTILLRIEEAKSQKESRHFFCSGEVRQFDN